MGWYGQRRRTTWGPARSLSVALVVPIAVLAGCAQATTPAARHVGGSASSGRVVPVSAAGNRERAERAADRLLELVRVPPGAVRLTTAPAQLPMPLARPIVASQVDRAAYWRVPMRFTELLTWLRAHPPRGLTHDGRSSAGPGDRAAGDSYAAPDGRGVTGEQLQFDIAKVDGTTTVLRVDALAIWLDPMPASDTARGRRLRVTVAGGCPTSDLGIVGVRSSGADLARQLLPSARPLAVLRCSYSGLNEHPRLHLVDERRLDARTASRVTTAIRQVDLTHEDAVSTSCPFDDAAATVLAFAYPGRPDVDIWYYPGGCAVIANGVIRAGLGQTRDAIAAAAGLLR